METQRLPEQQPAQLLELHVATALHLPKKQFWPAGHAAHVCPPMPHTWADCIELARHTLLRQQPDGQVAALHAALVQTPA